MKNLIVSILAVLVALVSFISKVSANADTVKYRLVSSYLPDSTLIRYELGSVCHIEGGARTYIPFANSYIATINQEWKTNTFSASPSDSLTFWRFASFDDQNAVWAIVD